MIGLKYPIKKVGLINPTILIGLKYPTKLIGLILSLETNFLKLIRLKFLRRNFERKKKIKKKLKNICIYKKYM